TPERDGTKRGERAHGGAKGARRGPQPLFEGFPFGPLELELAEQRNLLAQAGPRRQLLNGFLPCQGLVQCGRSQQPTGQAAPSHLRSGGTQQLKQGASAEQIQVSLEDMSGVAELLAGHAISGPVAAQPRDTPAVPACQTREAQRCRSIAQVLPNRNRRHRQRERRIPQRNRAPAHGEKSQCHEKQRGRRYHEDGERLARPGIGKSGLQFSQSLWILHRYCIDRHESILGDLTGWVPPARYNPLMVTGIEHVAIASPDPLRLAVWYVEHLDFVINYQPAQSRTVFIKAADGSMIEIIESAPATAPAEGMNAAGLRHLALTVADFAAVYARLKGNGVPFLTDAQTTNGNSLAFFADPDGSVLHLLHRETPLP